MIARRENLGRKSSPLWRKQLIAKWLKIVAIFAIMARENRWRKLRKNGDDPPTMVVFRTYQSWLAGFIADFKNFFPSQKLLLSWCQKCHFSGFSWFKCRILSTFWIPKWKIMSSNWLKITWLKITWLKITWLHQHFWLFDLKKMNRSNLVIEFRQNVIFPGSVFVFKAILFFPGFPGPL